mgnify:CR=1 FL=1
MKNLLNWLISGLMAATLTACRTGQSACPHCAGAATKTGSTNTTQSSTAGTGQTQVYEVRGIVREIRSEGRVAVIKHEEIPGYMAAMTMPFDVKDPRELAGVAPGDAVQFRLTVTDTDGWIDQIRVTAKGMPEDAKPVVSEVRVVREVEPLAEGDVMPDYPFVTETRRPIRLSEFRGQALGLTFIYTRCPYPTFCPRQSRQFVEATQRLKELLPGPGKRWHLLALSFDPAYDTPAVLHRYARQVGADPAWLNFCTGEMIEIDAITEQFGMFFARDGEGFSHNVRTVVVGSDGRIRRIFVGTEWTTEEFVAEMVKAAAGEG